MTKVEELSNFKSLCNIQTLTVLTIFIEIYGYPKWLTSPKSGQNIKEIISRWNTELDGYSIEQVKEAAYKVVRFKKSMSYPTVSHMLVYLYDVDKEANLNEELAELQRKLSTPRVETDPIRKRKSNFHIGDQLVLPGAYEVASRRILNEVAEQFPKLKGYTEIVRKAEALGLLDGGRIINYICEYMKIPVPQHNTLNENPFGLGSDSWGYKDD